MEKQEKEIIQTFWNEFCTTINECEKLIDDAVLPIRTMKALYNLIQYSPKIARLREQLTDLGIKFQEEEK